MIIGICGPARSGKDTTSKILHLKHNFFRIGLGDGIRSCFKDLDSPTWELSKELEEYNKTQRWAAQRIGTEARLEAGLPNIWLDLLKVKINYLMKIHPIKYSDFVIPDIRYINEFYYLNNNFPKDFFLWKLYRENSGLKGEAGQHSSEQEINLIPSHQAIFNNGTIDDLEETINCLLRKQS